jgi:hypothetical protein
MNTEPAPSPRNRRVRFSHSDQPLLRGAASAAPDNIMADCQLSRPLAQNYNLKRPVLKIPNGSRVEAVAFSGRNSFCHRQAAFRSRMLAATSKTLLYTLAAIADIAIAIFAYRSGLIVIPVILVSAGFCFAGAAISSAARAAGNSRGRPRGEMSNAVSSIRRATNSMRNAPQLLLTRSCRLFFLRPSNSSFPIHIPPENRRTQAGALCTRFSSANTSFAGRFLLATASGNH